MINTRTDADLSAAVQNALQTLLPQIRTEIREEFRTSSGPSEVSGNPPPVTIHTWLVLKTKIRIFLRKTLNKIVFHKVIDCGEVQMRKTLMPQPRC
nr:hypothetical protein [Tanacetum cinerariifolium]